MSSIMTPFLIYKISLHLNLVLSVPFRLRIVGNIQTYLPPCSLLCVICSHTGSHIIGLLQEEYKTWDGELMVDFGFLYVAGGFI